MFSLADVQAKASASGNGTIINFDDFTNTLFLSNVNANSLVASDFIFAAPNQPPTDIILSDSSVDENSGNGTVVGTLSAVDPTSGDSVNFTLLDDAGGLFSISGGRPRGRGRARLRERGLARR